MGQIQMTSEITKENQRKPKIFAKMTLNYKRRYLELLSSKLKEWKHYFPAVKTILKYKFTDPNGSRKVNSKAITETKLHWQRESE